MADGAAGQAPLTLQKRLLDSYPSRPGTPQPNSNLDSPSSSQKLYPKRPIQTTQEFYDWFGIIERSVAHSQEAHYREHLATVKKHLSTCKGLAEDINNVESDVDGMLDSWRSVESGGRSLKEASEQLLEERVRKKVLYFKDHSSSIFWIYDKQLLSLSFVGQVNQAC